MKKGMYVIYDNVAKYADEPIFATTDELAKIAFVNRVNATKAENKQKRMIYPVESLSLYRVSKYDNELPKIVDTEVVELMKAADCPAYVEED